MFTREHPVSPAGETIPRTSQKQTFVLLFFFNPKWLSFQNSIDVLILVVLAFSHFCSPMQIKGKVPHQTIKFIFKTLFCNY